MPATRWKILGHAGRAALLLLLAGLLIGRREFAHLNLGQLVPGGWRGRLFITETALLALFPIAFILARERLDAALGATFRARFMNAFGGAFLAALALCVYGALHALAGIWRGADDYLVMRQSALAAYPVIFLYTHIFFGGDSGRLKLAAGWAIGAALLCALLDAMGWLGPRPGELDNMPIYGQQTLPIAILGLGFCVVSTRSWPLRALALAGMMFAGWRQEARPTQSVVILGMAGAMGIFAIAAAAIAWRGQRVTLKRAGLFLAFFGLLGVGAVVYKMRSRAEQPGTETAGEMKAWNRESYEKLFEIYESTPLPEPAQRYKAWRPPYLIVDDPEVYKLNAVFLATKSVSVRNNMWRLLVWRRMFGDWRGGHWMLGSGVGTPWFYPALHASGFHYGDDREGLDPHNSYLNTLYRYGLIGVALLLTVLLLTARHAFSALRMQPSRLLEGFFIYSAYTIIFVFFTVGLEGPAYAFPFWFALGLVDAASVDLVGQTFLSARASAGRQECLPHQNISAANRADANPSV